MLTKEEIEKWALVFSQPPYKIAKRQGFKAGAKWALEKLDPVCAFWAAWIRKRGNVPHNVTDE